jgi:hypothetical protein
MYNLGKTKVDETLYESFTCDRCKHKLPLSSQVIHDIQCERQFARGELPKPAQEEETPVNSEDVIPCENCNKLVALSDFNFHIETCAGEDASGLASPTLSYQSQRSTGLIGLAQNSTSQGSGGKSRIHNYKGRLSQNEPEERIPPWLQQQPGIITRSRAGLMRRDMGSFEDILFGGNGGGGKQRGLDKNTLDTYYTMKYDEEKGILNDEEHKLCNICFADFKNDDMVKFLPCTHRFHADCVDPWLQEHPTCPNCKQNLRDLGKN